MESKAELARENARLQEQLENNDQSQLRTEQDVRTPSNRSIDTSKGIPSPAQSRGDQESRPSTIPSLANVDTSKVGLSHIGSVGPPLTYNSPSVLTTEQVGRRKIDDCFALYVFSAFGFYSG